MAVTAKFAVSVSDLDVTVTDQSTGSPTSWEWDFGDGTILTGQSPSTHSYSFSGAFLITLKVKDSSGNSDEIYRFVFVQASNPQNLYIKPYVETKVPSQIFEDTKFNLWKPKWQLYIAPQVDGYNLAENSDDVFDEQKWPYLYNILIGELLVYDFIHDYLGNMIFKGDTQNTGSNTGNNSANTGGGIKSVKTGPSEVEYHDSYSGQMDFFSKFIGDAGGNSGILAEYKEFICGLASRLGVTLKICEERKPSPGFEVYKPDAYTKKIKWPNK